MFVNLQENEKLNYTENLKSAQRQTLVVVSIPGLSEWAQDIEHKQNYLKHLEHQPNSSQRLNVTKLKRSYDDTEEDPNAMEVVEKETVKELKTSDAKSEPENFISREHLLNFPLPDVVSKSCLVKVAILMVFEFN